MQLTNGKESGERPLMGRPKLHMEAMILRLPKDIKDRIDALVGKKRRAIFIREAIERELKRRETEPDNPA